MTDAEIGQKHRVQTWTYCVIVSVYCFVCVGMFANKLSSRMLLRWSTDDRLVDSQQVLALRVEVTVLYVCLLWLVPMLLFVSGYQLIKRMGNVCVRSKWAIIGMGFLALFMPFCHYLFTARQMRHVLFKAEEFSVLIKAW